MNDMRSTIIPKSDQLNSDDLIGREMTIKITGVDIRGGQEQPVSIHFYGDNGKPYKACKSMCRVLVSVWGADASKYVGRSMTLYRDPKVKWGGMEVGGIRISHMSHIDSAITLALTVTRANKKPYTIRPLSTVKESAPPQADTLVVGTLPADGADTTTAAGQENGSIGADAVPKSEPAPAATITPEQAMGIEALFDENNIGKLTFYQKARIKKFADIPASDYQRTVDYVNAILAKREKELDK